MTGGLMQGDSSDPRTVSLFLTAHAASTASGTELCLPGVMPYLPEAVSISGGASLCLGICCASPYPLPSSLQYFLRKPASSEQPVCSQNVQQKQQAAQHPATVTESLIKQDPPAYIEEFLQQYYHYNSNVEIFKLQPNKPSKELAKLVMFMAQNILNVCI
ncbi:hypothetical protein P7K49_022231 [Saguinus oedipus]|uniref:Protein SDA1 n=1 Tax=Saguinus oedipus TaxID=9490 RepID=A0ABQ9UWN1_SAGOE|nr:hypothetical protein P7K49_022231 [Saguinus oedipus]